MSSTTVVDQLIVKLGLDPKEFTKGEKEIAAGVVRTKETVRKGAGEMSGAMERAAGSFAGSGGIIAKVFSKGGMIGLGIGLLIAAGVKLNSKFADIAENIRQLGLDARNFNTSAAGLRNMQNAAELAGGSLEDATASAGGLSKSLFDLKFNGQISESLIQLARLGVQFTDASGKARDFKDVALDTAEALGKAQANGTMSRAEAYQFASQAGFGGGMANLVADGRGAVQAALDKQEARRQVSGSDVDIATERGQAYQSLAQAAEAELGVRGMAAESPLATAGSKKLEAGLTGGVQIADAIGKTFSHAIDKASEELGDFADALKPAVQGLKSAFAAQGSWARGKMYESALDKAADKYGIDRDVLKGIARVESGNNPNAIARNLKTGKVTGKGLMQLNPQFFPNAGKNPYDDIDTAAQHFAGLLNKTEGREQDRYVEALRMYNAGETNYKRGTNLGPQNQAYAGKVLAGTTLALPTPGAQASAGSNNRTDITFETVNINTPRTDGEGVASEFTDATRRKLLAAHADTGMQ